LYNSEAVVVDKTKTDKAELTKPSNSNSFAKSLIVRDDWSASADDADAQDRLMRVVSTHRDQAQGGSQCRALALNSRSVSRWRPRNRLRPAHFYHRPLPYDRAEQCRHQGEAGRRTELVLHRIAGRVEVLDRRARDNPTVPGFDAELAAGYAVLLYELRGSGPVGGSYQSGPKRRVFGSLKRRKKPRSSFARFRSST